ncbi:uncharacterized protein [Amphiura filiformis]|uniref:uncharacterized protein n=1 Tax=Amphiura filiformis TaxID=82378 RepID=UPI003B21BA14
MDCMPNELRHISYGEISCVAFQKVDYGVVNALLPTDQFIPVDWEDRPTNDPPEPDDPAGQFQIQTLHRMIPLDGQGLQNFAVPQSWVEFTNITTDVKRAILARMIPPQPQPQPNNPGNVGFNTLHEAYQCGRWNTRRKTAIYKADQVIADIMLQNIHPAIHKWIEAVCDDFTSIGPGAVESLLEFLFPNIKVTTPGAVQTVVPSPSNTSINVSIGGGCAQFSVWIPRRAVDTEGRARVRTPLAYRVALRKADCAHRSRSKSRSPVRENTAVDPLYEDMVGINGNLPNNDRSVIDNPGDYIVKSDKHHHYFESHRPDLMVVQTQDVQDLDPVPQPLREESHVKLVCELSTTRKFGPCALTTYLRKNAEQCIQSCLSSLGYNQDLILGLVVVVDGFKLIKIEKRQNQGNFSYEISESDLILWNNAVGMHEMFHIISNIL